MQIDADILFTQQGGQPGEQGVVAGIQGEA